MLDSNYVICLLVHETWICLQHGNILLNPLCQRLDRNYGIALIKKDMMWVISLTLSAYWAREIISMQICYIEVSTTTRYLILISCLYHMIKSFNICLDASRKWSPKLGIMHLLLDYWHWDTFINKLISTKRFFLQAFDTYVHGAIVCDIIDIRRHHDSSETLQIALFSTIIIWIIHAIAVQISQKSTATLMVEFYKYIAYKFGLATKIEIDTSYIDEYKSKYTHATNAHSTNLFQKLFGKHGTAPHMTERDCQVCRLLAKPNHNNYHNNKTNNHKSEYGKVPNVVFLAHPFTLSSAFSFWLRKRSYTSTNTSSHSSKIQNNNNQLKNQLYEFDIEQNRSKENSNSYWYEQSWMHIFSPIIFLMNIAWWPFNTIICNGNAYVSVESSQIENHITEVWLSKTFGWQYIYTNSSMWKYYCRYIIEKSVLQADAMGVKVIGLGALNKAYSINKNGSDIVDSLPNNSKIRIVHGNTLTAAVVCEHIYTSVNSLYDGTGNIEVIITGCTSCTGRAIVLKLCSQSHTANITIVLVSTNTSRLQQLLGETATYTTGPSVRYHNNTLEASDKYPDALWVIGKSEIEILEHIPYGAHTLVFAVPNPFIKPSGAVLRPDIHVVDAGLIEVPPCLRSRSFNVLLPGNFVYACHAAAIIHHLENNSNHEVGDVCVEDMELSLYQARKHGFLIPSIEKATTYCTQIPSILQRINPMEPLEVDVLIVGSGSSGLAAAYSLLSEGNKVSFVIIDKREDAQGQFRSFNEKLLTIKTNPTKQLQREAYGWLSNYSDLELTSRPKYCSLPGLNIPQQIIQSQSQSQRSSGDSSSSSSVAPLTGVAYAKYLALYSRRFGIRGRTIFNSTVLDVRQSGGGGGEGRGGSGRGGGMYTTDRYRWTVTYVKPGSPRHYIAHARTIIVASGAMSQPRVSEQLQQLLSRGGFSGSVIHSSEAGDLSALSRKRVLLVGVGNSAIDISTTLLKYGAQVVHISAHSRPPIVPREWSCLGIEACSLYCLQYLPTVWADAVVGIFHYGHGIPPIDKGKFVKYVRSGRIVFHGDISSVRNHTVDFVSQDNDQMKNNSTTISDKHNNNGSDGDRYSSITNDNDGIVRKTLSHVDIDVIILCTGYDTDLHWLQYNKLASQNNISTHDFINSSHEIHKRYENENSRGNGDGLYFIGFDAGPSLLPIINANIQAKHIAKSISKILS
eukprot:gene2351-4564_t